MGNVGKYFLHGSYGISKGKMSSTIFQGHSLVFGGFIYDTVSFRGSTWCCIAESSLRTKKLGFGVCFILLVIPTRLGCLKPSTSICDVKMVGKRHLIPAKWWFVSHLVETVATKPNQILHVWSIYLHLDSLGDMQMHHTLSVWANKCKSMVLRHSGSSLGALRPLHKARLEAPLVFFSAKHSPPKKPPI